ncbi:MAG: hypothetical protein QXX08_07555 [Candidatus Bathyarchaeia archaeon]
MQKLSDELMKTINDLKPNDRLLLWLDVHIPETPDICFRSGFLNS